MRVIWMLAIGVALCAAAGPLPSHEVANLSEEARSHYFASQYAGAHEAVDASLALLRSLTRDITYGNAYAAKDKPESGLRQRWASFFSSWLHPPKHRRRAAHTYYDMPDTPLWPDWDFDADSYTAFPAINGWEQAMWGTAPNLDVSKSQTINESFAACLYRRTHKKQTFLDMLRGPTFIHKMHIKEWSDIMERALQLLEWAADLSSSDALWILGEHHFWGTHGAQPNIEKARQAYERLALMGNATAHARLGYLYSSRFMADMYGAPHSDAKALEHYELAANGGDWHAINALAFRLRYGIGLSQNCTRSLELADQVATHTYAQYLDGPPGGRTLPYSKVRLSDRAWFMLGEKPFLSEREMRAHMSPPAWTSHFPSWSINYRNALVQSDAMDAVLAHYVGKVDEKNATKTLEYARYLYYGSILSDHDALGAIHPNHTLAAHLAYTLAVQRWPTPITIQDINNPHLIKSKDEPMLIKMPMPKQQAQAAAGAATLLGLMYLRGEGVPQDAKIAKVWLTRAAFEDDPLGLTYLSMMYLYGYGGLAKEEEKEMKKYSYFLRYVSNFHPELYLATTELGKYEFRKNNTNEAHLRFKHARNDVQLSSPLPGRYFLMNKFEPYYLSTRLSVDKLYRERHYDGCPTWSIESFRVFAHRADWSDPVYHRGEAAMDLGDVSTALRAWSIAAEAGMEEAQDNIAYFLDPYIHGPLSDSDQFFLRTMFPMEPSDYVRHMSELAHHYWALSAKQESAYAKLMLCDHLKRHSPGDVQRVATCYKAIDSHHARMRLVQWRLERERDFILANQASKRQLLHDQLGANPAWGQMASCLRIYVYASALWALVKGDATAQHLFGIHNIPLFSDVVLFTTGVVGLVTLALVRQRLLQGLRDMPRT